MKWRRLTQAAALVFRLLGMLDESRAGRRLPRWVDAILITLVVVLLLLAVLSGCGAHVAVRKLEPGDTGGSGVRFALPRPFLRCSPRPDGTIDVGIECLPDGERAYAIDGWSVLGTHCLDVVVVGGILERVGWRGDAAAAAAQGLGWGGQAGARLLDEVADRRETALRRREEQEAEGRASIESARQALARAERELRVRRAELGALVAGFASEEDVLRARVQVAAGEAELQWARARVEELEVAAPGVESSFNAPRGTGETIAPGPVFYAIVERDLPAGPSVALKAVRWPNGATQPSVPVAGSGAISRVCPPELYPEGGVHPVLPSRVERTRATERLERAEATLAELRRGGATPLATARAMAEVADARIDVERAHRLAFTVTSSAPIVRVVTGSDAAALERLSPDPAGLPCEIEVDLERAVHMESSHRIRVELPRSMCDGAYSLLLGVEYRDGEDLRRSSGSVDFTVLREPEWSTRDE